MEIKLEEGEVYSSFKLCSVKECPDYNGRGYLFRHMKTGFEVFFFSTEDEECFFSYNVHTPAFDNSGVFHILEHTVLTGSRRYPVRDPFMEIDRNSVNTFLNAMTGPDRTYYPAASPVRKDFDNIFQIYTDAVFDPLLRKESFMQEGIRMSRTGFSGVVFSEMKGDVSSRSSVVFNTANRFLFDSGSPYTYESGGDPLDIVDLTYDDFIETYRKYYVPANMTLFLYGKLDILEKLEFLEREYLSAREGGEKIERAPLAAAWSEGRRVSAVCDSDGDDEGASVMVSWRLSPSSDPLESTILSLVVDMLLGNPGCPLYKAIIDSGLGKDISSEGGMNDQYSSLVFSVGFDGVEEGNCHKCEETVLSALKTICNRGLDRLLVESSLRRMEFRLQEIKEGVPNGYRMLFKRIDKGWADGKNPIEMLFPGKELEYIRSALSENSRFFEDWIEKNIICSNHRLLSVITPDKMNETIREKKIEEKFRKKAGFYSEEDETAYSLYENSSDSKEALETLPRLKREDIPVRNTKIGREIIDGILVSPMTTNGIVYADFVIDCSDLTTEELEYCSLLSRMMTMTNVGKTPYSEFLTKLRFSTGAFSVSLEIGTTCQGREKDYLLIRFKSLEEHYKDSLELILSLLLDGDYRSGERVKAVLRDIQSDYESSVVREGHLFALSSASRTFSPALYAQERTQGLSFWFKTVELLKKKTEDVGQRLETLGKKIFNRERITFHLVVEEENKDKMVSLTKDFLSRLPSSVKGNDIERTIDDDGAYTAYTLSSPVSYISEVFQSPLPLDESTGALRVFLSGLSHSTLWSLIREKGGAYGCGASLDINECICYFYTYRDPRLDDSIWDFEKAVRTGSMTESLLEDTKLRVLSKEVKPTGPQSRGILDLRRYLYGVDDELRWKLRDEMLNVTLDDLEKVRMKCLELMEEKSSVTVITGRRLLKKSGKDFREIKLPFTTG